MGVPAKIALFADRQQSRHYKLAAKGNNNKINSEDFPLDETDEYSGSVDWDAEWKKVVEKGGVASSDRPGKGYYKSEAEIAAIVSLDD